MFGLIRRLSYSVIPRPDRPWEDDPTSNAPHKPRKRRLSSSEQDDAIQNRQIHASGASYAGESATKRARGEGTLLSGAVGVDEFGGLSVPQDPRLSVHKVLATSDSAVESRQEQEPETQDVKEVTQGVKEVELEDRVKVETSHAPVDSQEEETAEETVDAVDPESVPLPDEDHVDELDSEAEESSNGSIDEEDGAAAKEMTADLEEQDEEQAGTNVEGS